MELYKQYAKTGGWLFRYRSYLPLFMFWLIAVGLIHYKPPFSNSTAVLSWDLFSLGVSFVGVGIRALVIGRIPSGTSGRNTREQIAEHLNTTGLYSLMRHPLYVGNLFCWVGISLFLFTWWLTALTILVFWVYYDKIMFREEEFLRTCFPREFAGWAEKTPAFFPNLRHYEPMTSTFSLRNVLKREYSGVFAITSMFTVMVICRNWLLEGRWVYDGVWTFIFFAGLVFYIICRTLKRSTTILDVDGR